MGKFMLGRKAGMTQIFNEDGIAIPVTVVACGPLSVLQNKTEEVDGYKAVKVGFEQKKRVNKPAQGQFDKAGIKPMRIMREFKTDDDFDLGHEIIVSDMFTAGDYIDVVGTSKGKGYQGVIKRHGYGRGPESHGSKHHRHAGSVGASATPGKVFKGTKMAGQMGNKRVTVQNLEVVSVDGERNILVIKGAVPGPRGGLLEITSTVKRR
ncbi:MAG TPA: 50S ribosomal protein L3 [Clostridiaceae bacterium]|nr:50S ribosomal protein L3 [Clostridiaceae bacterium]